MGEEERDRTGTGRQKKDRLSKTWVNGQIKTDRKEQIRGQEGAELKDDQIENREIERQTRRSQDLSAKIKNILFYSLRDAQRSERRKKKNIEALIQRHQN